MKCHCPACGRSTEIDPTTLDFFARCLRCGALLKAQLQESEGPIAAHLIRPGRVRESQSSNGQIANLLSRPLPSRIPPAPTPPIKPLGKPIPIPEVIPPQEDKERDQHLYALAPSAVTKSVTTIADIQVAQELPPKYRRRVALRERQQMLGMVTIFGIGMSALIAVGAIAIKSRDFFVRSARAHTNDTIQPSAAAPQTPAETPDATDAQPTDTPTQTPQFTVGNRPTANPDAAP